jgi:hypothetical protein
MCFDIGAVAERIRRYNCGIVISEISVQGVLSTIRNLLNERQLIEKLSYNTRNYVPPQVDKHFNEIISIIESGKP